jgi:sialate O-acetylesterase
MVPFHRTLRIAVVALCLSLAVAERPCVADVHLPHIFGNLMVLQRDKPIRFWGTADAGEKVTVSIGKNEASATADAHGKWKVELPAMPAGKPVEVKVAGKKNTVTFHDVLLGEVWVCSGQSNMQMSVKSAANAQHEIANSTHLQIRLFTVPMKTSPKPADDVEAYWNECTPYSSPNFSAVAYYFGTYLHAQLGVPIGLIDTSWGGTRIEPWTPPAGFRAVPAVTSILTDLEKHPPVVQLPVKSKKGKKRAQAPQLQQTPTYLYNAMIHPLVPFAIRGAIWYQGESNLGDGMLYFEKMKALIMGWRTVWNEGDFSFYYVQLAPYHYNNSNPTLLPLMWEAQTAALSIPDTGMAVINDIGNLKNIHPKDKQDVGKRLGLWALAKNYGKQIVYSGPLYKSMDVEGSSIRLKFNDVGGGLAARDGKPLNWFTIAGEDHKFVDAVAKIEADSIVVSATSVAKPVAVRFAWNQDAEPNFANIEGLPASAFRTDKW